MKSLLAMLFVACLLSSTAGQWVMRSIVQRRTVNKIEGGLGSVTYSNQKSSFVKRAVRDQLGKDYTNDVIAIRWEGDWPEESVGTDPENNLDSLFSLKKLEEFNGSGAIIKSFDPLVDLPLLRKVTMDNCTIDDLSGLERIEKLESFSLYETNFPGLKSCESLFAKLKNTKSLTTLDLGYPTTVGQSGVNELAHFTNLESLRFTISKQVSDLSPLSKLTNLRTLEIHVPLKFRSQCDIDLSFLHGLKLKSLSLHDAHCELTPILLLTDLENLTLKNPSVSAIQEFDVARMSRLKSFSLSPAFPQFEEVSERWLESKN